MEATIACLTGSEVLSQPEFCLIGRTVRVIPMLSSEENPIHFDLQVVGVTTEGQSLLVLNGEMRYWSSKGSTPRQEWYIPQAISLGPYDMSSLLDHGKCAHILDKHYPVRGEGAPYPRPADTYITVEVLP